MEIWKIELWIYAFIYSFVNNGYSIIWIRRLEDSYFYNI